MSDILLGIRIQENFSINKAVITEATGLIYCALFNISLLRLKHNIEFGSTQFPIMQQGYYAQNADTIKQPKKPGQQRVIKSLDSALAHPATADDT